LIIILIKTKLFILSHYSGYREALET